MSGTLLEEFRNISLWPLAVCTLCVESSDFLLSSDNRLNQQHNGAMFIFGTRNQHFRTLLVPAGQNGKIKCLKYVCVCVCVSFKQKCFL
jgi:hypothetical protein